MLSPVTLPNDVKSIEFRLGALLKELAVISNQTSEVQNSIANLKNGTHFIKKTLAETKYSVQVVDYQLKELTDPIVAMQANLRSILRIIRLVSIAVLVGVALVADSYFNWIEQFMVFSGKFSDWPARRRYGTTTKCEVYIHLPLLVPGIAVSDHLNCPCKVVKVADGDTVNVLDRTKTQHKIRLGGIDAPEQKQAFGRKATQNLAKYVAGEYIEVEYDKRDRYGRIVGKLLKDGRDIYLLQVKDGFAWHYKFYEKEQSELDRMLYSSAEIEARNKTIGLWSAPAVPPWEFRKKK